MSVLQIACSLGQLRISSPITTRRRSPRVTAQQKAKESRALATNVIDNDGLFVNIASYCDGPTLVRLCTASKADIDRRCRLAIAQALPWDQRREGAVQDEGWDDALRERVALLRPLEFARPLKLAAVKRKGRPTRAAKAAVADKKKSSPKRSKHKKPGRAVLGSPVKEGGGEGDERRPEKTACVVCAGPQVMRQGVHHVVLWGYCKSRRFEVGVVPPSEVRRSGNSKNKDAGGGGGGMKFSRSYEFFWDEPEEEDNGGLYFMIGLEFDTHSKTLTAYRFKHSPYGHWERTTDRYYSFNGDIVTKSRGCGNIASFYWAAESSGRGDEITIQRQDGPFLELLPEEEEAAELGQT